MRKFTFKFLSVVLSLLILSTVFVGRFHLGAASYVYDTWKNIIPSTEGITYKETYYGKDVSSITDPSINVGKFSNLADMEVFNSKIYIIDSNLEETVVTLASGDYKVNNVSKLYILNQNFQYENIVNEFLITDEVRAKLDKFYEFDTPLDEITIDEVNSTEYIDIYEAVKDTQTVTSNKATFNFKYDKTLRTNKLNLMTSDGTVIDSSKYDTELSGETTIVTFNTDYNSQSIDGVLKTLDTPGRAPYLPYSADPTKAAVRLSGAQGVTVTKDYIYIADTINARILKMTHDFLVVDVYLTPRDNVFYQLTNTAYDTPYGPAYETIKVVTNMYSKMSSSDLFQPRKVAVTPSGVLYVISANVYEGLVEFGTDTEFNRFIGKNTVTADPLKSFLSVFFTEEQLASFALSLPPMFNNISVSSDGFLYATSDPDSNSALNLVKIINTKGVDIMKRNGYVKPDGDAVYIRTSTSNKAVIGSSVLTAVAVNRSGIFTVADRTRGRLFTYDSEGNLLYITGEQPGGTSTSGSGNGLSNSIVNPVAIDYLYRTYTNMNGEDIEEETVIVLDNSSASIILFETTEFGNAVNTATSLYQNGIITDSYKTDSNGNYVLDENNNPIVESMGAESYWRQVIKMNTNYELAYLGIGKALLRRNQNKEAMYYFKLAHNKIYYSKAFANYRDEVLNANFGLLMTVVLVFVAAIIVGSVTGRYIKKVKYGRKEENE